SYGTQNGDEPGEAIRFVIRDGSTYYVSNQGTDSLGFSANNTVEVNGASNGLKWASFEPGKSVSFNADNDPANYGLGDSLVFSSRTFNNVTGVGFLVNASRKNMNATVGSRLDLVDFQAEMSVTNPYTTESGMNVILIVADDLRNELNCYGADHVISPNIDRLANMGMRFDNAYSQLSVCNPSRASFLSGLRPEQLGILDNNAQVRILYPNLMTFPILFRSKGYYTAGIGKIYHAGVNSQGNWAFFQDPLSWMDFFNGTTTDLGKQGAGRNVTNNEAGWANWLAALGDDEDQRDGQNATEAMRLIENHHEEPFFIGIGFHKPHDPFHAPAKYFDMYPIENIELEQMPADRSTLVSYALSTQWDFASNMNDIDRAEFKRSYLACTTFTDAQIGRIFSKLDEHNLWDSTIVIFIGDHGYHLGEQDWWNKVTLYDHGVRVPMIMWVPGASGMGQSTSSLVELVDLYPTLVDYLGFAAPHQLAGKSLKPILDDPAQSVKNAAYSAISRDSEPNRVIGRSIRTDDWRYTQWNEDGIEGRELYDVNNDTLNYYNLAGDPAYADVEQELKAMLENQANQGRLIQGHENLTRQNPLSPWFSGSWFKTNTGISMSIAETGLEYSDPNYRSFTPESIVGPIGNVARNSRPLANYYGDDTNATFYVSFLMQVTDLDNTGAYRGLEFHSGRQLQDNPDRQLQIAIDGDASDSFYINLPRMGEFRDLGTLNTNVNLFVLKVEMTDQARGDSVTVWQNPDLSGTGEPAGGVTISDVDLQLGYMTLSSFGGGEPIAWDEIRLGRSFEDVVETPDAEFFGFYANPPAGFAEVELSGVPNTTYQIVESDDLDFSATPVDSVNIQEITVGYPEGSHFSTDAQGKATVRIEFEAGKKQAFFRGSEVLSD
ncbi:MULTISPECIES: sulfatase, partial [unclassified Lentimonas]